MNVSVTAEPITEFSALSVTRRIVTPNGPAADELYVNDQMRAWVRCHSGEVLHFELDATQAEELVQAMQQLAGKPDVQVSGSSSPPVHDLELIWNGEYLRFHDSHLATDEALHGAIDITNNLIDGSTWLHAVSAERREETLGLLPSNGNTGVVPPWLRNPPAAGPGQPPVVDPPAVGQPRPAPGVPGNGNGGIVPPWLQPKPVDPDTPHIMDPAAGKLDARFAEQLTSARDAMVNAHGLITSGRDSAAALRQAGDAVQGLRRVMGDWEDIPNDLLDSIDGALHEARVAADVYARGLTAAPGSHPALLQEAALHMDSARRRLDVLLGA